MPPMPCIMLAMSMPPMPPMPCIMLAMSMPPMPPLIPPMPPPIPPMPPSSSSSPAPELPPSTSLYHGASSFFLSLRQTISGDLPFFLCNVTPSISLARPESEKFRVLPPIFEMVRDTDFSPDSVLKSSSANASKPSSSMYTLTCFFPSDQPYFVIAAPIAASASPLGRESSQLYLPAAAPSYSMGFFFFSLFLFACFALCNNWLFLFGHGSNVNQ